MVQVKYCPRDKEVWAYNHEPEEHSIIEELCHDCLEIFADHVKDILRKYPEGITEEELIKHMQIKGYIKEFFKGIKIN